jgi:hypothetical protein
MKRTGMAVLGGIALLGSVNAAQAELLVHYDPSGQVQTSSGLGAVTNLIGAGLLTATGFGDFVGTNAFPVGTTSTSDTVDLGQYLEFTVDGGGRANTLLESITYRAQNYLGNVPLVGELRYSGDNYQDFIAQTNQSNGTGITTLTFDFSDFFLTEATTFRIYFYDADPNLSADWFDLIGTARVADNSGLRVNGSLDVAPVPVPAAAWLMGSALLGMAGTRRRRKA